MKKMLSLPVALALALGTSNALALGLGQVQVKSSLNQPLLAEIPVLESTPGEAAELQVKLASAESFARIGLERPSGALLSALKFEVVEGAGGRKVVRISTPNRVSDPFVSLLLEAEWGRGKLLREYTLLLDPPVAVPSRAQPSQTRALPGGDVRPAPAEDLATPPAMATPRAAAPARPAAGGPGLVPGESYGPVSEGDSLWKIASRAMPTDGSVNINQMMVALQRANPDAFIGGNINRLRTGAVLRIPSRDELSSISAGEAAQVVREQSGESALQPAATGGPRSAASQSAASPPDSRLAIVPPRGDTPATAAQTGAARGGDGAELRADLARAREQSEALNQENRELRTRVQELEKIRGDSERLLELRNSELQALQQRLAELEALRAAGTAPAAPSAAPAPTPDVEAAEVAAATPDLAATESNVAGGVESAAEGVPPPDLAASETEAPTLEPTATEAPVAVPPNTVPVTTPPPPISEPPPEVTPPAPRPPQQAWYQNPLIIGGGGALVVGLLALFALRGRGKKKAAAATAAAGSRFEGTDFGVPGAAPAAADVEDYSESEAVDAEERELLDALAEQPDDLERHLDLVRYYYGINDPARFEGAVEAMYAQVYDPDEPAWQQALQMGREMLPDHPLFMDHASASASDQGWESAATPTDEVSQAQAYSPYSTAASSSRDQDEPEFRIDLAEPELEVPEVERAPELETPSFTTPSFEAPRYEAPEPESAPSAGGEGLTLDAIEAAATKLELARAYLDMGDVEGARGMLEEVAQEGTAEQRQDARRLLDEIR
jgi:pilus assembly protein FimV